MRLVITTLLALGMMAPVVAAPGTAKVHTVTIEGMQFNPQKLSVHRGDRIQWVNKDLVPHTVTASGKAFDSGSIAPGASWSYGAATSGEFAYGCTFHPTMKGKITVQ